MRACVRVMWCFTTSAWLHCGHNEPSGQQLTSDERRPWGGATSLLSLPFLEPFLSCCHEPELLTKGHDSLKSAFSVPGLSCFHEPELSTKGHHSVKSAFSGTFHVAKNRNSLPRATTLLSLPFLDLFMLPRTETPYQGPWLLSPTFLDPFLLCCQEPELPTKGHDS